MMHRQGTITSWKDEQGYGFITSSGSDEQVFFHISSLSDRRRRPVGRETVAYEVTTDDKGRTRAVNVTFIGNSSALPRRPGQKSLAVPVLFLIFVAASVLLGNLPFVVLALYLAASAVSFILYARDKAAAARGQWRVAEDTLHLLSLLGGWPGALVAQNVLRHKSKKASFQLVFVATVILNCAGLVWLHSPSGAEGLRSLLEAAGFGN
jgi:uncharacterized membrane protein YsdA (DUF1294 family)/cold shock CspA family protein